MKPITPCLWFDHEGEEAAKFYVSIIKGSKIREVTHYGENMPRPKGSVMTVAFELNGQPFLALNGGPNFKHSPPISLIVHGETQGEIDEYWEKLSAGGEKGVCGWLTDKFGVSWQVVPTILERLVSDKDPQRTQRVMGALMQMKKLDIAGLERAAA